MKQPRRPKSDVRLRLGRSCTSSSSPLLLHVCVLPSSHSDGWTPNKNCCSPITSLVFLSWELYTFLLKRHQTGSLEETVKWSQFNDTDDVLKSLQGIKHHSVISSRIKKPSEFPQDGPFKVCKDIPIFSKEAASDRGNLHSSSGQLFTIVSFIHSNSNLHVKHQGWQVGPGCKWHRHPMMAAPVSITSLAYSV